MKRFNDLSVDPSSRVGNSAAESPPADESVEALEEALESARLRLQQRLADETAGQRAESQRLKDLCEQLRAEAVTIEEQTKETAARIEAEARQTEAQILAEAKRTVDAVQTRLRDGVGPLLERAATEIVAVQKAIGTERSAASADKDSGASGNSAVNPADERVVMRLIVRPAVAPDLRRQFKERIAGVDAALFGAVEDESFQMLVAHEHSANLAEEIVAMAPAQIRLIGSQEGSLEVELTSVEWLEASEADRPEPA